MPWLPAAVLTPTSSLWDLVADFPTVWHDQGFLEAKRRHGFRLTYMVTPGLDVGGVLRGYGWQAYGDFLELVFGDGDLPLRVMEREFRADRDFSVMLILVQEQPGSVS